MSVYAYIGIIGSGLAGLVALVQFIRYELWVVRVANECFALWRKFGRRITVEGASQNARCIGRLYFGRLTPLHAALHSYHGPGKR